ncbi:DNA helicase ZGRF1-like domain-containing protein [Aspergillus saccharolyticus JOP 1030-1]|uniref:5'-3' DNA helicase ZGRF1-like N-terminal domain-containing protein n=1 Tax=Aspergillus saccharolyticus JOP 1030-1 TaxID=1450539 RepID=A0A318Z375_9EURO|nr:hypothetical protein BP01DRAFT_394814 [Aspergillus saccharolyticus JOP 1030-1]PYH41751.1 hypothetical protein BP01DRAFT_394814 [Aspergillus saccharolyticus JOP 1030-1]
MASGEPRPAAGDLPIFSPLGFSNLQQSRSKTSTKSSSRSTATGLIQWSLQQGLSTLTALSLSDTDTATTSEYSSAQHRETSPTRTPIDNYAHPYTIPPPPHHNTTPKDRKMTYHSTPSTPYHHSSAATSSTQATFATPLTQNTAPVIKHRCLFTHDTRRKAKRWQDGYLRYHTFNKRIMAYDTSGNFIGDLHWRQEEAPQEGDEVELDRGVLVQVCEAVGRSETDLSGILPAAGGSSAAGQGVSVGEGGGLGLGLGQGQGLGRGRQGVVAASPSPLRSRDTVRSVSGVHSGNGSQLSMRSLNDLLGIRKTLGAGTAATWNVHGRDGEMSATRAAKRPRVEAQQQQQAQAQGKLPSRRPAQPRLSAVIDLTGSSTTSAASKPARPQLHDASARNDAGEVSREGESGTSQVQASRGVTSNPQLQASKQHSNPQLQSRSGSGIPPPQPCPPKPDEPPVLLRLSTSKPRKKLMYSALLPGGGQIVKPASSASVAPAPAPAPPSRNNKPSVPPLQPTSTTPSPAIIPKSHDFAPSTSTQAILNELTDLPESTTTPATTTTTTRPQPHRPLHLHHHHPTKSSPNPTTHTSLRKSYSDPTALTSTTSTGHKTNPDPSPSDQGPWTREALDLFEFWPAGRVKPV